MKGFISYSHHDSAQLQRLHVHLAHLKREGILKSWTDEQIPAGGNVNTTISVELESSQLFIALLSPDYIASNYCFDKEFSRAMKLQEEGKLTIVPVILQPCEWQNTPFRDFKALPKDGKPVSEWENQNTAYLDITQNIRKLIAGSTILETKTNARAVPNSAPIRNYRVKKDFDSIQRLEFSEASFKEISDLISRYLGELVHVDDNIKFRILKHSENEINCILVNRNKIGAESNLTVALSLEVPHSNLPQITYSTGSTRHSKSFVLSNDDYHLFWSRNNIYFSQDSKELSAKEITDIIWDEWLESVGII